MIKLMLLLAVVGNYLQMLLCFLHLWPTVYYGAIVLQC